MTKRLNSKHKVDRRLKVNLCLKHLDDRNFFKPTEKKMIMLQNLRNIFYKMDLSEKETRILSSVFASIANKKVD